MWAGQLSGEWSRMWWVKLRRVAGMPWKRSMTWRYSLRVVRRTAMPRCQPSIRAREKIQAMDVPQASGSRVRQGRRVARAGP